jgi:hypothetical protein
MKKLDHNIEKKKKKSKMGIEESRTCIFISDHEKRFMKNESWVMMRSH